MYIGILANLAIFSGYFLLTLLAATFIEFPPKVNAPDDIKDDLLLLAGVPEEGPSTTASKKTTTTTKSASNRQKECLPFSKVTLAFKDLWYTGE